MVPRNLGVIGETDSVRQPNNGRAILYMDAGTLKARLSDGSVVTITGGGGGAPTTADYLVKTANGSLSAERVVTDTSTITWDWGTSGQAKASASSMRVRPQVEVEA